MLIQIFLQLVLALLMGLGPLFGVEAQVLCIEKDGHAVLESLSSAELEAALPAANQTGPSLCASHHCPGCHDIFIGPAQRSATGPQHHHGTLAELPQLQLMASLPLRPLPAPHALPPPAPRRFAAMVPSAEPPLHLPSTLLLI